MNAALECVMDIYLYHGVTPRTRSPLLFAPRFPSRRLSGWTNHISSMTPQMSSNTSCLERLPSISLSLSSYLPTTASTLEWCTWRRFFAFSSVSSLRWVRRSTTSSGGGEREVVDLSRLGVEAAADDALDQHLVGDVEEEEGVGLDALLGDGVRLRGAARVPVEEPALLLRVGGVEGVHHHGHHARVGDEVAAVHVLLGLEAGGGALLDRRAEEVARGDVHEAVLLDDELALRALTGGGAPAIITRLGPAATTTERRAAARGAVARFFTASLEPVAS